MYRLWHFLGLVVLLGIFGAPSANAVVFPEPIARAAKGQLQCYGPNIAKRTCAALVSFDPVANGKFRTRAIILISPTPPVFMSGTAVVAPKAGELCGRVNQRDFDDARFSDGETELEPLQSAFLRTVITAAVQNYFDREICGAFVRNGGSLVVTPTMDGAPIDADPQRVIWVTPEDNYRVAP